VPFDALIVDNTAELDQILSAQHARTATRRLRSPHSKQSTSSSSSEPDTPDPTSSKPKFSDALSHLAFSPKRPRSPALRPRSASPAQKHGSARRLTSTSSLPGSENPPPLHPVTGRSSSLRVVQAQAHARESEPTPRPRKVQMQVQNVDPKSNNVLRPPTPSTGNSNFTRLAKGLAREIEAEQSRWHAPMEVEGIQDGMKKSGWTQAVPKTRGTLGKL
jgi:hypothetical protein